MNIQTLLRLSKIRGLSQAELAAQAGISKQAITAWKKKFLETGDPNINIFSKTQDRLAQVLSVQSHELNQNLYVSNLTELLWDRLYPDIESFVEAIAKGQLAALARLVQVYGLYSSAKMAGSQIWRKFPNYKSKLHPAHRKQLEVIWNLEQNPAST